MSDDFNGYMFDKKEDRKKMKYIIIKEGCCWSDNPYGCRNLKEVKETLGDDFTRSVKAVFKVEDITSRFS